MNPRNPSFILGLTVVFSLASGLAVAQSKKSPSEGVLIASYKNRLQHSQIESIASQVVQ